MLDEQQETGFIDSEVVTTATLDDSLVEPVADVHVIQRITRFHSTPLPDAVTLDAYAKLIPNGADRVMSLVEHEAAHRRRHESAGHWMAFTLTLALAGGGFCLGLLGHEWLAAALFTTTIGAVVTALVVDSRSRQDRDTHGEA
jgi:uncharacterized membrane protein